MSIKLPDDINVTGQHNEYDFGDYKGINLNERWVMISDKNMKDNLENIQNEDWRNIVGERSYFQVAELLAKKIVSGKNFDDEDITAFKTICLISASDAKLLKGAIVILTYLYAQSSFKITYHGRRTSKIPEGTVKAIMIQHEKGLSVRKIADNTGLNESTIQNTIKPPSAERRAAKLERDRLGAIKRREKKKQEQNNKNI